MTASGAQVPLDQVADLRTVTGPSMIRNENGLLVGYVYVDVAGRDLDGTSGEGQVELQDRYPDEGAAQDVQHHQPGRHPPSALGGTWTTSTARLSIPVAPS